MEAMPAERELLDTAIRAAEAAAKIHRLWSGRIGSAEASRKGRADFVSRVDLEAQQAALDVIEKKFPGHEILPEEDDPERPRAALKRGAGVPLWVVDPLDGTTNFLHGHPAHVASVGVWVDDEVLAGAVVAWATEERWWAGRGEGAFRNGSRIRTSTTSELETSLIGTGFPFKHPDDVAGYLQDFEKVLRSTSGIRRGGSAALDLCYLAQGSLDAFWERTLDPWDVAGGLAILSEAGGVAMRTDGRRIEPDLPGSVLAANSDGLAARLRDLLDSAPEGRTPRN
jgi:myo-inositol-1(or 4)-monophosphatase